MPYLKCKRCHHEWEEYLEDSKVIICDWCKVEDHFTILEEMTPIEKTIYEMRKMSDLRKFISDTLYRSDRVIDFTTGQQRSRSISQFLDDITTHLTTPIRDKNK